MIYQRCRFSTSPFSPHDRRENRDHHEELSRMFDRLVHLFIFMKYLLKSPQIYTIKTACNTDTLEEIMKEVGSMSCSIYLSIQYDYYIFETCFRFVSSLHTF